MNFSSILIKSWEIIWKNKVLWIFGILASCGAGNQFGGSGFNYSSDGGDMQVPAGMQQFFNNAERWMNQIPEEAIVLVVFGLICVAFFIGILAFLVSVFGRVALIRGAQEAASGASLSFSSLSSQAGTYYPRALGLNLVLWLIVAAVVVLVGLGAALVTTLTLGIGLLCIIPLLCLLVPLGLIYAVYTELANVALVTEDLGIGDALSRAWNVMRSSAGSIAVMALILIVGSAIAGLVISLPFIVVGLPALIGFLADSQQAIATGLALTLVGICIAIPISIVLNGILRSYIQSAWTLTYIEAAGSGE